MILITLGGIPDDIPFLERLRRASRFQFVIPGASPIAKRMENLLCLPHRSTFYHPDLVFAADAVVGKAGYSTIAEVFSAGKPFGFIPRPDFPESRVLVQFIETRMTSRLIPMEFFYEGEWIDTLDTWITGQPIRTPQTDGAAEAARLIRNRIPP